MKFLESVGEFQTVVNVAICLHKYSEGEVTKSSNKSL